jgi:LytR cell envelope-related transcriptional attenuator
VSNSTRSSAPSSSNGYDERYVVPLEASRRGAHRARVSPIMAVLPVVAVVGIVIGAVALVYVLFGKLGGGPDTVAQVTATPAASTSSAPTTATTPGASAATPGASASATAAAGTADKTIKVSVYNGSGTAGLGRKAADKLTAAGWPLGQLGNWTGAPITETTVYYGSEGQHASAQSIARTLGKGVLKLSAAKAGPGIAVVVGPDFRGGTTGATGPTASRTRTTTTRGAGAGTGAGPAAGTPKPTATGTPKAATPAATSPKAGDAQPTTSPAN